MKPKKPKKNEMMSEEEMDALVKKTMDEVMDMIAPALEGKHDEYLKKRAKDKAEDDEL